MVNIVGDDEGKGKGKKKKITMNDITTDDFDEEEALFKQSDIL